MTKVLHINSSPRSDQSQSLSLAKSFLSEMQRKRPESQIDALNLFTENLPPFGTAAADAKIATFFGKEKTPEQVQAWSQLRAVFDRFVTADAYVFNIPMWNHGLPYILKQWIDIITQPGWAFSFDPGAGYTGLLEGKKAFVVYTSGVYTPGRPEAFGVEFQTAYFKDWLRFIGITDVTEIKLFGQAIDPASDEAYRAAESQIQELATQF